MPAAFLAVVTELPPQTFELKEGTTVIGRSPEAGFQLNHREISRSHCRFALEGEQWTLEDLASRWGTRVNGTPVSAKVILKTGDRISLGPVLLLFEVGSAPSDADRDLARDSMATRQSIPALFRGKVVTNIPLAGKMTLGREGDVDILLADPAISRKHAAIEHGATGFRVIDLNSTSGSFVNGKRFAEHDLIIGDRLQVGSFFFQFDGRCLLRTASVSGGAIHAMRVCRQVGGFTILNDLTLNVAPCRFAGILGPSGAGKSTLLDILSGLRPPSSGKVLVDEADIHASGGNTEAGYVPQDDLVHPELTVSEALRFSARLRLPAGTPPLELQKLVIQTMERLGLRDRASHKISRLSGGQRKRVSVAVELLARPAILFLDEPTSGLDPATEFKLMELLRGLADTGCTVVCTTHVMENVYLMDRIAVLLRGSLVFDGSPQEAREYFGVQRLSGLYDRLEERPPAEWQEAYRESQDPHDSTPARIPASPVPARRNRKPPGSLYVLAILLARQFVILKSDWRNMLILFGQPVVIACLVSWASRDVSLALFFTYIATLWFGCSNAAQEIVKEIPIYRRERIVGAGRNAYLASKVIFLGAATLLQGLILYGCLLACMGGPVGSVLWQSAAVFGIALSSVGIGLAISALVRSLTQAVFIVPLALIPLILFSGYTVPANEMKPSVFAFSRLTPSFASQVMMDTSFLWNQKIARATLADHWTSFRNLNRDAQLKTGVVYTEANPALLALLTHAVWALLSYVAAFLGLRAHEKRG